MSARRKKPSFQSSPPTGLPTSHREPEASLPRPASLFQSILQGEALWVFLLLTGLTLLTYSPVWNHEFVAWDDPYYVAENPNVAAGLTWQGIRWAFSTGHMANWHPVTWISHLLDVQFFGLNPGAHHTVSLLIHVLNTLLLFGLLQIMLSPGFGALGISGFVAGLFAVHPLHVESVAWVAERKDVLSTLFLLAALLAYVRYVRQPGRGRYFAVMIFFALGLMSKPMLVTFPFLLLLLDVWPLGRVKIDPGMKLSAWKALWPNRASLVRLAVEKIPLFGLSAVSSVITVLVQQGGGSVAAMEAFPLGLRIQNAIVSYAAYLGKTLWPARLAAFYPYRESFPAWLVAGCALILMVLTYLSIRFFTRTPYITVGWFWYLGTLVPVIGLVQVGGQPMADRYTYVPLIGIFLAVACFVSAQLDSFARGRRWALPAAGIVILACAVAARGQAGHWRNSITLWEHTLRVTENNFTAHTNLGHALLRAGRPAEAVSQYQEALLLRPNFADAHQGLGVALASQGNWAAAISHYEEALRLRPNLAEVHNYLGAALARQELFDQAVEHYTEALRLRPEFADARNNLGAALASQGKYDEALREFLETLRFKPTADVHYNVATMYEQTGDIPQAVRHYQTALQLDPGHQSSRAALDDLTRRGHSLRPSSP